MKLDLSDVYSEIDSFAIEVVDEKTDIWFKKLQELTPEDTFDLQNENARSEVDTLWTKVKARIYNESEYAEFVEYSKQEKKYYKGWWRKNWWTPFTTWKGAWMFRKTKLYLENN
jgi:hypothetical protein